MGGPRHFARPAERAFTRKERGRITVLFGGLTGRHDQLIAAALEGLGYTVAPLPLATKADFQAGKEYGNNGQCNPTYFTVGALVNYLKRLRDVQNVPTQRILADYVFVTAGSCGPCRFGMYEAEYRLALRNAGFDGFRVLIFAQEQGLSQSGAEAGLEMSPPFFASLVNAVFLGDLLNEVAYHIRPYEVEAGTTERVFAQCLDICRAAFRAGGEDGALVRLLGRFARLGDPDELARLVAQVRGRHLLAALQHCRRLIDTGIEVDYTRPKPIAKVTGEFWAQTTEGDGNFHMFRFLEGEGAEVLVEPVATWIDYSLHYAWEAVHDRRGLGRGRAMPSFRERLFLAARDRRNLGLILLARRLLARAYERRRRALGATAHPLASQFELQRAGHPYYNSRCGGGEGHLEVAKNIYYSNKGLAHLVLSLKPFGCMPSTQSDGAQAAVLAHYPDMTFLPVETSGEGDINAYSRVQMVLGEAKAKCKDEFRAVLTRSGYALEDIRAYVAAHRELRRPLQHLPRTPGVIGRAANFVLHVAGHMDHDRAWRGRKRPARGDRHGPSIERSAVR